jgi:hypothetical protein
MQDYGQVAVYWWNNYPMRYSANRLVDHVLDSPATHVLLLQLLSFWLLVFCDLAFWVCSSLFAALSTKSNDSLWLHIALLPVGCELPFPRNLTAHISPAAELWDGRLDGCWSPSTGPSKTVWMHPLNPFLRALFRSTVPGQCIPVENHVGGGCEPCIGSSGVANWYRVCASGLASSNDRVSHRFTRPGV